MITITSFTHSFNLESGFQSSSLRRLCFLNHSPTSKTKKSVKTGKLPTGWGETSCPQSSPSGFKRSETRTKNERQAARWVGSTPCWEPERSKAAEVCQLRLNGGKPGGFDGSSALWKGTFLDVNAKFQPQACTQPANVYLYKQPSTSVSALEIWGFWLFLYCTVINGFLGEKVYRQMFWIHTCSDFLLIICFFPSVFLSPEQSGQSDNSNQQGDTDVKPPANGERPTGSTHARMSGEAHAQLAPLTFAHASKNIQASLCLLLQPVGLLW